MKSLLLIALCIAFVPAFACNDASHQIQLKITVDSHLGDLPTLHVDIDGNIKNPILAPRIKLHEIKNRALIIDSSGDNHSDLPASFNTDNKRVICGIIK